MRCLITYAKPWGMVDEKTGEKREGVTVEYLMTEDLMPVVNTDGSKGVRHCKESLALDKWIKIQNVPAFYDLKFDLKPGSKGKPVMKLDDLEFLEEII